MNLAVSQKEQYKMPSRILKAKEVAERVSISTSQVYRLARDGRFPEPVKITENRSGWLETEVDQWIDECIRRSRLGS
jgi:prophage regulatory protein